MADDDKRARWSDATFMIAFFATAVLLAWISLGFLLPLVLAVSAVLLLAPLNEKLVKAFGGKRWAASLLMTTATFVVILGPLVLVTVRLVQEIGPFFEGLASRFGEGRLSLLLHDLIPDRMERYMDLNALEKEIRGHFGELAAAFAAFAATLPARAANMLIDGSIMFIALYAYFVRGPKLVHAIIEATPMEKRHTERLLGTIGTAIRTVFMASFITAIIQFGLGYLAFAIVDVPYALALAAIMAFFSFIFSLVPVLGSGLVWGPVALGLIFSGRPFAGIFIILWGVLVLGSVDNIVKPLYAKDRMQLSPLLVLVTVFGGVSVLGPVGALLGPLIAALAAAFLRIWTTDFLVDSEPLPKVMHTEKPERPWFLKRLRRRHA